MSTKTIVRFINIFLDDNGALWLREIIRMASDTQTVLVKRIYSRFVLVLSWDLLTVRQIQIISRRIKCPIVSEGKGRKEIGNRNVYDPAGRGFVLQEPPLLRLFDRGLMFSTNRYVTLKKT